MVCSISVCDSKGLCIEGVNEIFHNDDNSPPEALQEVDNDHTLRKFSAISLPPEILTPTILKISNEFIDDTSSKSESTNQDTTRLSLGNRNLARISKSSECLSELSPMTACMMLPASMSLEDIAGNNMRLLSTPEENNNSSNITSKLVKRLKGLRGIY